MSTRRIYLGTDRVTISKPGFDAVSPPAVDYKYLALDSRLNNGRPLEIGIIPNFAFGTVVPFTTTYAGIPAVDIVAFSSAAGSFGFTKSIGMRDANSSIAYNRTSFYLGIWNNQFTIVDDAVYTRSFMFSGSFPAFLYIAWQAW